MLNVHQLEYLHKVLQPRLNKFIVYVYCAKIKAWRHASSMYRQGDRDMIRFWNLPDSESVSLKDVDNSQIQIYGNDVSMWPS